MVALTPGTARCVGRTGGGKQAVLIRPEQKKEKLAPLGARTFALFVESLTRSWVASKSIARPAHLMPLPR